MKDMTSHLFLLSSCLLYLSSVGALPGPVGPRDALGNFEELLGRRDEPLQERDQPPDWLPEGAPAAEKGETMMDWITRVIDDGHTDPLEKRDDSVSLGNPNITYTKNPSYTSVSWTDEQIADKPVDFNITTINPQCDEGLKPNYILGKIVLRNGTEIEDAPVKTVITELVDIQKEESDVATRFAKIWEFTELQAKAGLKDFEASVGNDFGQICPAPPTNEYAYLVQHDELRRLLAIEKKRYYYIANLVGSVALGSIIAAVQAGITKGLSPGVQLGWEAWLNSAVAWILGIFFVTETSRFAPSLAGGQAWGPIALWAWLRQAYSKTRQWLLTRGKPTAASVASSLSGANSLGGGSNGGGNNGNTGNTGSGCLDQTALDDGTARLNDMDSSTAQMMNMAGLNFASPGEHGNILPGDLTCRAPGG